MGNVTFALHQLGWSDFQSLCHTITREILGQTVVRYLDGNDGGRDGAFSGTWTPAGGENFHGEFVIQAKHTTKPDSTLGPAAFDDELDKAERLATAGLCDVYVLMTNAGLTGSTAAKLQADLSRRDITQCLILGATWINQTITENSRLRMLVPRLYGLGDLTQILDERAYQQARAVLDSMRTDLAKLVRTTTYERTADALDGFGFVLLTGARPPARPPSPANWLWLRPTPLTPASSLWKMQPSSPTGGIRARSSCSGLTTRLGPLSSARTWRTVGSACPRRPERLSTAAASSFSPPATTSSGQPGPTSSQVPFPSWRGPGWSSTSPI